MTGRTTIKDVARHAGVSKSTVSLVLQNSDLVKKETRAKVERSIEALNYVYNRAAAKLRGVTTDLIGLLFNDLRNPYFAELAMSTQRELFNRGYATVVGNADENREIQSQVVQSMLEHGVSAILISPCYGTGLEFFERLERSGVPCLFLLRNLDPISQYFPFLSIEQERGGYLATRHLIELGTRKVAYVGGHAEGTVVIERVKGYQRAMDESELDILTWHDWPTRQYGRDMASVLITERPDIEAVVGFNDSVAHGLLAGFAKEGVKVGEDILLIGFDDLEESHLSFPTLSSIKCDTALFGRKAADMVYEWLVNDREPPKVTRKPVELVARQSSLGL